MSTTELVLPESVDWQTWDADMAAMMEFAGLTWFEGTGDDRRRMFAPAGIMGGFIAACRQTGLDPTQRQIYAALMGGKWVILIGVDGFRVVAQRTGEYDGQDPIEWQMVEDGPWHTTPGRGAPYAARIRIYRKGISRPLEQVVTYAEFGGTGTNWTKRPAHMLGIRAETHAFRRSFPMQLSGLYTAEDFQDDGTDTSDAIVVEPTEDWPGLIEAAQSKEEIAAVVEQAKAVNEFNDKLRTLALTRYGMFNRDETPAEDPAPEGAPTVSATVDPRAEVVIVTAGDGDHPERDPAEPTAEEYAAADADQAVQS